MFELVPPIESPCVNICRIERGACAGCGRTLAEIGRWGSTTDADRRAVMAELPARMAARGKR
jgi:hypothetical protein